MLESMSLTHTLDVLNLFDFSCFSSSLRKIHICSAVQEWKFCLMENLESLEIENVFPVELDFMFFPNLRTLSMTRSNVCFKGIASKLSSLYLDATIYNTHASFPNVEELSINGVCHDIGYFDMCKTRKMMISGPDQGEFHVDFQHMRNLTVVYIDSVNTPCVLTVPPLVEYVFLYHTQTESLRTRNPKLSVYAYPPLAVDGPTTPHSVCQDTSSDKRVGAVVIII